MPPSSPTLTPSTCSATWPSTPPSKRFYSPSSQPWPWQDAHPPWKPPPPHYGPEARQILDELLDKYTEHGAAQFEIPEILELPPINRFGNVIEIARLFGGDNQLIAAVNGLQAALYAN